MNNNNKRITIGLLLLTLLAMFFIANIFACAQDEGKQEKFIREYVFVLDTSGSMISGTTPLKNVLIQTVKRFIDEEANISNFFKDLGVELIFKFYPFDAAKEISEDYTILSEITGNTPYSISTNDTDYKNKIHNYLDSLKFEGNYTHICRSLEYVVVKELVSEDHPVYIRLYTDGKENEQDPVSGKELYPPPEEFFNRIEEIHSKAGWTDNKKLKILTLGIEWEEDLIKWLEGLSGITEVSEFDETTEINRIYIQDSLNRGLQELQINLVSTESQAVLYFDVDSSNEEINNWNSFINQYPDIQILIEPSDELIDCFENDLIPIKLADLKKQYYDLESKIIKDKIIEKIKNKSLEKGTLKISLDSDSLDSYKNVEFILYNEEIAIDFIFPLYTINLTPSTIDFTDLYDQDSKKSLTFSPQDSTWDKILNVYPNSQIQISEVDFKEKNIEDCVSFNPKYITIREMMGNNGVLEITLIIDRKIMKEQENYGLFEGAVYFTSNEENITITPERITFQFEFVRPEVEIQTAPLLDFGSLGIGDKKEKEISLIFNQKSIENDEKLSIFFEQEDTGKSDLELKDIFYVNNKLFDSVIIDSASEKAKIRLDLTDKKLEPGNYRGKIFFHSDNEQLFIKGDNLELDSRRSTKYISWDFQFLPPPKITVDLDPEDFGVQDKQELTSLTKDIKLKYNNIASGKKDQAKVSWSLLSGPSGLEDGQFYINGEQLQQWNISPDTEEFLVSLNIDPSKLKHGTYKVRLFFEKINNELEIEGDQLSKDNSNRYYVDWTFRIPWPPWLKLMAGLIALLVIFIIAYIIYVIVSGRSLFSGLKFFKCVIPDETYLYVRNINDESRQQYDISGKKEIAFGKDSEHLTDAEGKIILKAVRENNQNALFLDVLSGEVKLRQLGSKIDEPAISQPVFNRDIIILGNYNIRISSLNLEKKSFYQGE